jgi:hypothetical protein
MSPAVATTPRRSSPSVREWSGLREVSYAEFKRACQARGPRGPLHGYWRLLDRFAGYWFSSSPQARPAERPAGSPG